MVDRRYLLDKAAPPSALKRWIDQAAVPAAIDLAAGVEMALERAAVAARRNPLNTVAMAAGGAFLLTIVVLGPRRHRA